MMKRCMSENKKALPRSAQIFNNGISTQEFFDNPFWDIKQAAYALSVPEATLRDWVYKRQIPFKKVGNLIRFVPSEIHQWIEERNAYVYRGS